MTKLKLTLTGEDKKNFEESLVLEIGGRRFVALDKEVSQILAFKLLLTEVSKIKSKTGVEKLLSDTKETLLTLGVSQQTIDELCSSQETK